MARTENLTVYYVGTSREDALTSSEPTLDRDDAVKDADMASDIDGVGYQVYAVDLSFESQEMRGL